MLFGNAVGIVTTKVLLLL